MISPGAVTIYTCDMRCSRLMLTVLMILWLPLQGFAAVAMPFCKHALHAPGSESVAEAWLVRRVFWTAVGARTFTVMTTWQRGREAPRAKSPRHCEFRAS